jgi:selenium metabolism protein YedF
MNTDKKDLTCNGYVGKLKRSASKYFTFCRNKEDVLLVIGTDALGKEEEIGKILVKGFFETMRETKEVPHTIFFLNAGVKLTTENEEIIPVLKEIESMGVEIYSCGTCLKYYDLEDRLKVGHRGATNHIIEGIKDFKKVVWI